MPSVFNHDNSCWGVRRSFCNVFQYELQEEVQTSKIPELAVMPNSICPSPVNNSVQYSVSSNGYYGYQPHSVSTGKINDDTVCECSDDCAMDVEDNSHGYQSVTVGNEVMINCNILDSTHFQNHKRKRHLPDNSDDDTKRMRQEEPAETDPKLPTHINHRKECISHSKCLMSHFM